MTKNVRGCPECGGEFAVAARGRPRRYCGRACQARAYRARSDQGPKPRRATSSRPAATPADPEAAARTRRHRSAELDRETIIRTAVDLADTFGLDQLSMRVMADRLDVPVMSLYRHVSGKHQLITAMIETVLHDAERADPPTRSLDAEPPAARTQLEAAARREWALYRAHPWVLRAIGTTRPPLGTAMMNLVDLTVGPLTRRGLDTSTALSVFLMLSGYVQGMALLEVSENEAFRDTGVSGIGWWSARREQVVHIAESGRYPWLSSMLADAGEQPDASNRERWFTFGLERVLDGIGLFLAGHRAADQSTDDSPDSPSDPAGPGR